MAPRDDAIELQRQEQARSAEEPVRQRAGTAFETLITATVARPRRTSGRNQEHCHAPPSISFCHLLLQPEPLAKSEEAPEPGPKAARRQNRWLRRARRCGACPTSAITLHEHAHRSRLACDVAVDIRGPLGLVQREKRPDPRLAASGLPRLAAVTSIWEMLCSHSLSVSGAAHAERHEDASRVAQRLAQSSDTSRRCAPAPASARVPRRSASGQVCESPQVVAELGQARCIAPRTHVQSKGSDWLSCLLVLGSTHARDGHGRFV